MRSNPTDADRTALAKAAGGKKSGWFKRIDIAEDLARSVLNPEAIKFESPLTKTIDVILTWVADDGVEADDGNA